MGVYLFRRKQIQIFLIANWGSFLFSIGVFFFFQIRNGERNVIYTHKLAAWVGWWEGN